MPQTSDSRDFAKMVEDASVGDKFVLAEGDSWFDYPRRFFLIGRDANIIDHLANHSELKIYNSSSNGDEALTMLSGEQKFSLIKRLKYNFFHYLLFSGGGNDIVGKYDFDFFIRAMGAHGDWSKCVRKRRVKLKIGQIEGVYRTLCELVIEHSQNRNIRIITHTYEKLIPRDKGFAAFDLIPVGEAWLHPYLVNKKITKKTDQRAIVAYILDEFKAALHRVEKSYPFFEVVDTHGTVRRNEWRNEIHPTPSGFGKLAKKVYAVM